MGHGRTERDDKTGVILRFTSNSPARSSLEAFARGVLVPGSIFCDNLNKEQSCIYQLEFILCDFLTTIIIMRAEDYFRKHR